MLPLHSPGDKWLVLAFNKDDCRYMAEEFVTHHDGFDKDLAAFARDWLDRNDSSGKGRARAGSRGFRSMGAGERRGAGTMTEQKTYQDVWEMLEDAPDYAKDVADLYYWSTNYDAGQGPMTLFLDLIGWSADEMGEHLYSLEDASLGYLELGKLADALKEYTDRPIDVRSFVNALMTKELSE